jgi:ribonuclease P protein component
LTTLITKGSEGKMDERFGKDYKLCSRSLIEEVFKQGESVKSYPLKLIYLKTDKLTSTKYFQIAISVPKRNFKSAVDRNYIKRMLREVIRKNKLLIEPFLIQQDKKLALFLIFGDKEMPDLTFLDKRMKKAFNSLIENLKHEE